MARESALAQRLPVPAPEVHSIAMAFFFGYVLHFLS
jgi:hypothetical protein